MYIIKRSVLTNGGVDCSCMCGKWFLCHHPSGFAPPVFAHEAGGAEDHRSVALSGASLIVSRWQPLYLYTLCSCHLDMISPFNIFVRSRGLVFTLPPSKRPRKRGALFGDRLAMEAAAIWNGSFVRWHRSRASSQHITWLCLMMGGGGGLCLL